jgi:hypothetical protein
LLVAVAAAQMPTNIPQFSADMKMTGRGESMAGKMYFGNQKVRFDMSGGGHEMIMINDTTKKTAYMLMPQQKMYMEMNTAMQGRGPRMPDAKPVDPSNPCSGDSKFTCNKVGTETVNGRSCDKWEFTNASNPKENYTVWIDQKLHFPIKNARANGDVWELQNLKEGAQAASLFEVPSDYNKMDMGGMMGRPPKD